MTAQDFYSEVLNFSKSIYNTYPMVIEIDGEQYNIEVDTGYRKLVLRPTDKCVI